MSSIVEYVFCQGVGRLFLLLWITPAALITVGYLIYIAVKVMQELRDRKKR